MAKRVTYSPEQIITNSRGSGSQPAGAGRKMGREIWGRGPILAEQLDRALPEGWPRIFLRASFRDRDGNVCEMNSTATVIDTRWWRKSYDRYCDQQYPAHQPTPGN